MPYRTAIFDLDGTMLDTLTDYTAAVNHALVSRGMPSRSVDEVRLATGNGIEHLMRESVPERTTEEDFQRAFDAFKTYYAAHNNDATHPYDGMLEMVSRLRGYGVRCALVSNKADFAVQALTREYFGGIFDYAMGERAGIPKKPAPDMCDVILADLGVTREGLVYVGDSEVDIATARNLGCDCIICSWGFRDRSWLISQGAERIVDTPAELGAAILA